MAIRTGCDWPGYKPDGFLASGPPWQEYYLRIAKPIGFGAAHDIEKIRRRGLKFGYGMTKTKARHDSSARHDTNTTWEEKKKKKRRTKLPSRIKPWPGLSQKISSPAAAIIRRVLHRLVIVEDVISITIESVSEEQKAGVGV
ncbi:hypothetical protein NEUTE1DRAFT_108705 [Neurospora tetrasperma FGSC 2508]|uniref:Uncharacterized protein n=1 Tax=Neurospora tetrasperma (strain FGSC 2508 / ATCC MYA-4615 / P0657) TaxID=510951 RepID=F8MFA7_NEUT8|nr:uncharacterized protein NEUTE1DRAFT_108705 [Neurospora tetrasperma FGSC 2508]EGO59166.1 hypothetical protein NEUTE1DRAFT_108705 [Neurospora tetrasperma FGSC 2508]EGZ73277.1 hypothetical protein NEUTE2DRAFT_63005 [Neurospora tetrasperma FGSC 2509]